MTVIDPVVEPDRPVGEDGLTQLWYYSIIIIIGGGHWTVGID